MISMIAKASEFKPLQRVVPLVVAVVIVLFTIELIRRRKLREEYAMLWLAASVVLMLFAIFPRLLFDLGQRLHVNYATLLTILCFTFLSIVSIHFAVAVSRSREDTRQIAQRLALLEQKLEAMGEEKDESTGDEKDD